MTAKVPLDQKQAYVYAHTTVAQAYRRAELKYREAGLVKDETRANAAARRNERAAARWQRSILRNM